MRLAAIVALSENHVIGKNNTLPWHLPADLRYFKQMTLGKPILMGRKTHESIGRPLPGRQNMIITRDIHFQAPGCSVFHSIDTALASVSEQEEVMVIGGALLYEQMLSRVQRLYVTYIHCYFEGDVFFPQIHPQDWRIVSREDHPADDENAYPFSFVVMDRVTDQTVR